jgi:hypothetical protein
MYEYGYLNNDSNTIISDIRKDFINNFTGHYTKSETVINGWNININELKVFSLNVKDFPNSIKFSLSLPVSHDLTVDNVHWKAITTLESDITVPIQQNHTDDDTVFSSINIDETTIPPDFGGLVSPISTEMVFCCLNSDIRILNGGLFAFPLDLWNRIIDFGQANQGFPSKATSGQYFRMLYLSAGISTSSAFGDIVPITTSSRIWVLTESVLAIITIGLFLNSLANVIAGSRKEPRRDDYPELV